MYVVSFHLNLAKLRNFLSKNWSTFGSKYTRIIYGVAVWNENVITLINASYKNKYRKRTISFTKTHMLIQPHKLLDKRAI